jgi:hypothetical protein
MPVAGRDRDREQNDGHQEENVTEPFSEAYSWSMRRSQYAVAVVSAALLVAAVGCSSTGATSGSGRDWFRSYVHSVDQVWRAAITVLSENGYYLEDTDEERGRIRAESPSDRAYSGVALEVRIEKRREMTRVDVQASGGAAETATGFKRIERVVLEFLDDLDDELGGPPTED